VSVIDASTLADGTQLRADLCVVGSGAAGLTIAVELAGSSLDVLLVESGGLRAEAAADELADFERSTPPPLPEEPRRARAFGGTTNVWYGRLARLDEIDFAGRAWVPHSGWPITRAELLRYEARGARFFGLDGHDALGGDAWRAQELAALLDETTLQASVHVWPHRIDLGRRHLPALRGAPNVRVLLHAHATRLRAAPDGDAISSLTLRGADGRAVHVAARGYVLACGGWENPRLLLLSRDRDGRALGNRHDAVGRYYMNHPRNDGVARLFLAPAQRQRRALFATLTEARDARAAVRRQFSFRVAEQRQRHEQLLNAETFLYPVATPRLRRVADDLRALPRGAQRDLGASLRRLARIAAEAPLLARAALHALARRPFLIDHLALVDQSEQRPDPASRITLGERRDRFGDPLLRVHWSVGADTTRSLRRLHELLGAFFASNGIGRLESALFDAAYEPRYLDAAHPMGTTRMSADPRAGVVDASCRVHGVANLWIAGSSTFPTGGRAAPTWTIACLALRLADELRATLARC